MKRLCELEQPILLVVVHDALGAGKHGVVVRHDYAASLRIAEKRTVHLADARNQAVGRGLVDQLLDGAPLTLRRDHQRAIFDERLRVDQVRDVLPCRPLTGLPPSFDGPGAVFVEAFGETFPEGREVGSNLIEALLGFGAGDFL